MVLTTWARYTVSQSPHYCWQSLPVYYHQLIRSWSRWPLHQPPWTVYSRVPGWSEFGRDIRAPVYICVLQLVKQPRWMGHRLWCRWWKAPKDGISLGCWTERFFLSFFFSLSIPVLAVHGRHFCPMHMDPTLWVFFQPHYESSHLASIISTQSICFSLRKLVFLLLSAN